MIQCTLFKAQTRKDWKPYLGDPNNGSRAPQNRNIYKNRSLNTSVDTSFKKKFLFRQPGRFTRFSFC